MEHNTAVFVDVEKEGAYCKSLNIEYRKLTNGATILGFPRTVSDDLYARLEFEFQGGSFNDPKGKRELHHLLEHLIANKLHDEANEYDAGLNARTFPFLLTIDLSGCANPEYKNYGVWPMFEKICDAVVKPLSHIKDLNADIEREKTIVKSEITERRAHTYFDVDNFYFETIFAENNPIRLIYQKTEDDLFTITEHDVTTLAKKLFIPNDLVFSYITYGEQKTVSVVADMLEKCFYDWKKSTHTPDPVEWELCNGMNPNFKPGGEYIRHTELPKETTLVRFVWTWELENYSLEKVALNTFHYELGTKLFEYIRKHGIGYSSSFIANSAGAEINHSCITVYVPKRADILSYTKQVLYPAIRAFLFEELTEAQAEMYMRKQQLFYKAAPLTSSSRMEMMTYAYRRYGRIVDADLISKMYSDISAADLLSWRDKYLSVDPAIIISGDIE